MKIVYMGTPDFAVAPLEKLIELGHEITAVVTQPDRPKGRSGAPAFSPVKECALKHGIRVLQPERLKAEGAADELKTIAADIYVVAAFGQILPKAVLEIPRFGCVNIHASLLPKYRGAAPIQWAVINGDEYAGVTIMQMNEGLDTGDILLSEKIKLSPEETGGSLFDRLSVLGCELIGKALVLIEAGKAEPAAQNEAESSYARMLKKEDGRLDFSKSAVTLERLIRGVNPWPGAFTSFKGKQLKIWKAALHRGSVGENSIGGKPGTVTSVSGGILTVACGEGTLDILELQLEGKKRMGSGDFLRGMHISAGERLGD
ncbi:MAG: methionyl-tRNA formyltransferase [Lachnospiraceae bacterium]|nr:methionyl-tRNA formyltransferase [Lachnospiraceae bacterium]